MASVTRLSHCHRDERGHLDLVSIVLARAFHKTTLARQIRPLK